MAQRAPTFHGLLIVDKPGLPLIQNRSVDHPEADLPTSHDVVQRVRRWSHQRRIGHTGTLDPMASGVLMLCLGQATRLVEYYQGHDKVYFAEVTLGQATDTYDALGKVVDEQPAPPLTREQIDTALARFRGEIWQTPPIYSAIKQGGESLHRKARRGEEVKIDPRRITIHELSLVDWIKPDRLHLRVRSSAGAYMRSLAYDLGVALGVPAHLSMLRREAVGGFTLADAHTLDDIESAAANDRLDELILPAGRGLAMPRITLDADLSRRLGFGQKVALPLADFMTFAPDTLAQGYDEEGRFLGILRALRVGNAENGGHEGGPESGATIWKAEKWFASQV